MTCQVKIEHPRGFSCELGKLNGLLLEFGEDVRLEREDTWQIMSTHTNLNYLEFVDGLVTL